jgi:signal transduction histidine kinase
MPPETELFPFRGELAALIRAKDWTQTPLGPPSGWPPSLHTLLRLMLTSRFAMWMGWGPDLTFFYNDEYAQQTLGPKHPWALGRSSPEVWSEIWDTLKVRIDHVLATGEATWDEGLLLFLERNGYPEETYHTFSYSPAPSESPGVVGGLFCVVIEETERVIGERRIALLRDFASLLNQANTGEDDVLAAVGRTLAGARDIPFSLTYLFEEGEETARLVSCTTIDDGHPAAPARLAIGDETSWPLRRVIERGAPVVVELSAALAWPTGPWKKPPTRALVLPIAHQGHKRPAGVFVAGLNPHRPFEPGLQSFVELFVGQFAAGLYNARAYEEERKRSRALAELDRAKTVFFSNVSHEFRTPLTLMVGPSEEALADESEPLGPRQRERLELLRRNALRLGKLVNTLLDFARFEAGKVEASYAATDLAAATRELASLFESAAAQAGLRLDLGGIEDLPEPVYVDRDHWEKIVLNLISNALKFTFEGAIRVSLHLADDGVELAVADTGIGIAAGEMPRLFERFHRIRGARSRTHEGTGIGLALVQELARLHGGAVRATSEPGKGTSFFVHIKRGREHLPPERVDTRTALPPTSLAAAQFVEEARRWLPDESGAGSQPDLAAFTVEDSSTARAEPRARVLIADDNGDMRSHLTRLLSGRYAVEAVTDGLEALRAVEARRPDLLLTDVMMPNLDGFELVRALRSTPATRDLPIVMLSARAGEEATQEGLEAGVDDYLIKPFSARELLARVDAQISRAQLRAAEAAHRDYLASVFESAPVGIAILHGPEHVFAFANARYLALLPHKQAHELLGLGIREALPELAGQGIYEILADAFRTGAPYFARSFRLELPRGNGGAVEETFFDFEYQPIRAAHGAIEGIVVVVYEVTELARARAAAEAASRAKDEFLAMLGHELRNPLAPIMTAVELMGLSGSAPRERMIIDRQVRHVMRLVDDLLDVSRIASAKITLSREPLDISDVLADAIETASPMLEHRAHRLRVTAPPGKLFVDGDRVRLAQVVGNLLTNAAKYTDTGGEIEVTATPFGTEAIIAVRDNGQGLSPELLPRVFDLFAQGTRTIERSQGGLGLGLAIVKNLVALHGGTVSAESDGAGLGSVFTVRLPRIAPPADADGAGRESGDSSATAGTGLRVLVVDDNQDGADLLDELLRSMGHTTRVAYDGLEGVKAAAELEPEVALIDIGLPVMDGYEVAKKLRELLGPSPRLIAVTGYGQASDRARALEAGFDHHIVKPVELSSLSSLLVRRGEKREERR